LYKKDIRNRVRNNKQARGSIDCIMTAKDKRRRRRRRRRRQRKRSKKKN
jgi:hypothetical protein